MSVFGPGSAVLAPLGPETPTAIPRFDFLFLEFGIMGGRSAIVVCTIVSGAEKRAEQATRPMDARL